jgi:DNA-binding MarR family transcriptional regulator
MSTYLPEEIRRLVRKTIAAVLTYTAVSARRNGLGLMEIAALEQIYEAGELTPTQLGKRLAITSGTTTGLVDRLEQIGYVERVRHPHDRRSSVIRPKPVATSTSQARRRGLIEDMNSLHSELSDEERTIVGNYLVALTAILHNQVNDETAPEET